MLLDSISINHEPAAVYGITRDNLTARKIKRHGELPETLLQEGNSLIDALNKQGHLLVSWVDRLYEGLNQAIGENDILESQALAQAQLQSYILACGTLLADRRALLNEEVMIFASSWPWEMLTIVFQWTVLIATNELQHDGGFSRVSIAH